jgi:hypothetical protein
MNRNSMSQQNNNLPITGVIQFNNTTTQISSIGVQHNNQTELSQSFNNSSIQNILNQK